MGNFSLGEAVLGTSADLRGLQSDLDRAEGHTRGWLSSMGGIMQSALGFAVGNFIVGGVQRITGALQSLVMQAVDGNAAFEQYTTQFGVLLGSAEAAHARIEELAQFGATTPFDLPEVVQADLILQGFGLHAEEAAERFGMSGSEIRRLAGDMAAGTGSSFEEMSILLGRFSSGATGEAVQRMAELGIATRAQMREWGIQFDGAGKLTTPVDEAFTILLQNIRSKYGGMMEAQSQTFTGMLSNLRDWVGNTLRALGQPIFETLKEKLQGLLAFLGSPEVQNAITGLAQWLQGGIATALDRLEPIATRVFGAFRDWLAAVQGGMNPLAALRNVIGALVPMRIMVHFDRLMDILRSLFEIGRMLFTGDFRGGIFGLDEDHPVILSLWNIRRAVLEFWDIIQGVGAALGQAFGRIGAAFAPVLASIGDRFYDTNTLFMDFGDGLGSLSDVVLGVVVPAIEALAAFIIDPVIPAIDHLATWFFEQGIPALQQFAAQIVPVIGSILEWLSANLSMSDVLTTVGIILGALAGPVIAAFIAGIIGTIQTIAPLVAAVIGIVAAVAALRAAWDTDFMGIRTTLTDFWTNTAQPALSQLWMWLQENIPAAIQWLSETWTTVLLPAFEDGRDFFLNTLIPALSDVWEWLQTNVPAAIQTLTDVWEDDLQPVIQTVVNFWNTSLLPLLRSVANVLDAVLGVAVRILAGLWENVLLPVLQIVWNFVEVSLLPLLRSVGNVVGAVIGLAVRVLAGLWENVLLPALRTVWGFIETNFLPILREIGSTISTTVGPRVAWFKDTLIAPLEGIFNSINQKIKDLIWFLDQLASGLNNVQLPDWLERHSPAPIEQTLMGMVEQLRQVNALMPDLMRGSLDLRTGGAMELATAGAGSGPQQIGPFIFEGVPLPRNEQEAEDGAFMLVDKLRSRGAL